MAYPDWFGLSAILPGATWLLAFYFVTASFVTFTLSRKESGIQANGLKTLS
jgi:hypothetical protein